MKSIFLVFGFLLAACSAAPNAPATPLIVITPLGTPVPAPTSTALPPHAVWVIAHRGGAAYAPENTLASFKNGIALGADFIEMDTHLSKDGVVVVIHDPTLERTTDGTGRVADKTLAELQSLNAAAKFKDGKTERQPVPTFAQVLDLLKGNAVQIEVEIKVPPQGRYVGIEEKLIKEVVDRNLVERVQVSSFDFDVLTDVKRISPKTKTVALMTTDFFRRVPPDQPAKVMDAVLAIHADLIAVNKDLLTAALVQEAQRRGVKVEAWTVDSEAEMQKFVQMGVDGIITNQPDVLKKVASGK